MIKISISLLGVPGNGTGFLIGRRHILTAAHVLYDIGQKAYVKVEKLKRHGFAQTITLKQRFVPPEFIALPANPSSVNFARHDYAMILTNEVIDPSGPYFFPNYYANKDSLLNRTLVTFGYPGATRPCRNAPVLNPAKYHTFPFGDCGDNLYSHTTKCVNTSWDSMFQHQGDIISGMSGGPLYEVGNNATRIVRGIVSAVTAVGNYAHRVRAETKTIIEDWVDSNP